MCDAPFRVCFPPACSMPNSDETNNPPRNILPRGANPPSSRPDLRPERTGARHGPASTTDPCCSNVVVSLIGSTITNLGCDQIISQTWQAVDLCCFMSNTCTRTVTVLPSGPILLCSNLTITCGSPIRTKPPAYTDPCCSNVVVSLIGSTITNLGCDQIISQTWQAVVLCCFLSNTCTRTVTVLPSGPLLL